MTNNEEYGKCGKRHEEKHIGIGGLMIPVGFILLVVGWVIPKE